MSFYLNENNTHKPCRFRTNNNGFCEKVLIEVNRVFDACIFRDENVSYTVNLDDFTPSNPKYPLKFVSAVNDGNVVITSTTIDRTDCRGNFAKVTVTLEIPLIITYTDDDGVTGTAKGTVSVTKCAILAVPQNGLTPTDISVMVNFVSYIGTFISNTAVTITACLQIIIKVVGLVDILVPSYGYPCIPICNDCGTTSCDELFREPIYPT